MKKTLFLLSGILLGTFMSSKISAQAINEGFEDVNTLVADGWVTTNLSSPIGTSSDWFNGAALFAPNGGVNFIAANFNSTAGAGTISNWLITPNRTFTNGDVITFFTRTVDGATYADRLQVRLSTNGASTNLGATATSVGDFTTLLLDINPTLISGPTGYPDTWTQYTITISGLGSPTSGRMAFRYFVTDGGPSGTASDNIGIDDFLYTPFGTPLLPNVTASKPEKNYTLIPLDQVTALPLAATISNIGLGQTTDATLTANVYMLPNLVTPVYTASSTPATLAVSASSVEVIGSYTPPSVGDYVVHYISTCTDNTVTTADTAKYEFSVTPLTYARDNGQISGRYGIGAAGIGYIGAMYDITNSVDIDSVLIALRKEGSTTVAHDGVGDSTRITIFDVSGGLPNNIIDESPAYVFTPADTGVVVITTHEIKAIGGGNLTLTPGKYLVAVTEYNTNIGIAYSNDIFNTLSYYVGWTGQPYAPVEDFGAAFMKAVVIRPILDNCINTTSSISTDVCYGSDHTYTDGTISTNITADESLVIIMPNAAGCDSTITEIVIVKQLSTNTITTNICTGATHVYSDGTTSTNVIVDEQMVFTYLNAAGCDSTVTEMVVVNTDVTNTVTSSVCYGSDHTYGDGVISTNVIVDESRVYIELSAAGCDSTVTEMVTVSTQLDLSITNSGETLTANATGATYQWIDCDNGNAPITSETSQTFTPTVSGNYAVVVTEGGCSGTSACETVNVSSIDNLELSLVELYPNPTSDVVKVVLKGNEPVNYIVTSADGKKVMSGKSASSTFNVDLSQQPAGIYMLTIEQDSVIGNYRVMKK